MNCIMRLGRSLTGFRSISTYALLACVAPVFALYSCSNPPSPPQQPTAAPTTISRAPLSPTTARITPTPVHEIPTPPTAARPISPSIPKTPTTQQQPTAAPPTVTYTPQPPPITPTPVHEMPAPPTVARPIAPSIPKTPTTQQRPTTPTSTSSPNTLLMPLPHDVPFTQITIGKHHTCGLQTDGTALCGGGDANGSTNAPDEMTFRHIAAGMDFTCGLRHDRTIACWGENNAGQSSPPEGRFDEIAVGYSHACALDGGALTCWGNNFLDGAETIQEVPPISAIQGGGGRFICGLTPDDDMACWDSRRRELEIVPGPFMDIGIGTQTVCAIRADGSGFCSESGEQHHASQRLPIPHTKFVQISSGFHHACGITESSYLECWSAGDPAFNAAPLAAPRGEFAEVSTGWRYSCALRPNGHAICWGYPDTQTRPIDNNRSPIADRPPVMLGDIKFRRPTKLFPLPEDKLAVVELEGYITIYSDESLAESPKTMLDLTNEAICCMAEGGFLSAALDPQFERFPFLYVWYNLLSEHAYGEKMPGLVGRLARFRVDYEKAVKDSELTILEVPQPTLFHNGGDIQFGPDGMLYLGIGEGDFPQKSQSLDSLYGKIIRIDVRGASPEQPYRIPPDNPFVGNLGAHPEIWTYGLRNPWRMDFAPDGRLFVADVGADTEEEVSIAAAGANLGWPICEGNVCEEGVEANADGLTAPIFSYSGQNGCAIIGGVTVPWLNDGFVFSDLCDDKVWLLEENEQGGWRTRILTQGKRPIFSFGLGADGTLYMLITNKPIATLRPQDVSEFKE